MKYCILLFFLGFFSSGSAQNFDFYAGNDALGHLRYGLRSFETGRAITKPKWYDVVSQEINQFGQPLAAVSDDFGEYFHLINTSGQRVSLFTFNNFYEEIFDTRLTHKGDLKVRHAISSSYFYKSDFYYYLNEDCACDPRPFYPCPARFPMDTLESSQTLKNIQVLQNLVEFYTIDSALNLCRNFIEQYPNEPQYPYYKAFLIDGGYIIAWERYSSDEYDEGFPRYIWDEFVRQYDKGLLKDDEVTNMYLQQYEFLKRMVKERGSREIWFEANKPSETTLINGEEDYEFLSGDHYLVGWYYEPNFEKRRMLMVESIEAFDKVLEAEIDEEIELIVRANQNQIIDQLYWLSSHNEGGITLFKDQLGINKKEILNNPYRYEALSMERDLFIIHLNSVYRSGAIGGGLSLNLGVITNYSWMREGEIATGIGYNHFFLPGSLGEFYLDWVLNPFGFVEMRFKPSIMTNWDGVRGMGFLPEIGVRLGGFFLSYGYNFANKSKFNAIQGNSFGLSYSFGLNASKTFNSKTDDHEMIHN